jgi:hypothetical protein
MSTTGVTTGTVNGSPVAVGDGVDDTGVADGPEDLPKTGDYTIAVTVSGGTQSSPGNITRVDSARGRFGILTQRSTSPQQVGTIVAGKNNEILQTRTTAGQLDGSPHLIVVTKSGDNAQDFSIFVDDMVSPKPQTIVKNQNYQTSNYVGQTIQMGFFCRNTDFTNTDGLLDFQAGRFQFFDAALSEQERKNVKARSQIV